MGAGLSAISIIPYVGDLAKTGKIGRWTRTIEKTIRLARKNANFADKARPIIKKLIDALEMVPADALPESVRNALNKLRKHFGKFGKSTPHGFQWAKLADSILPVIDRLDLNVPPNKGMLWSRMTIEEAKYLARRDGLVTLEMLLDTPANKKLWDSAYTRMFGEYSSSWSPEKQAASAKVWQALSEKYAANLKGTITAFVDGIGTVPRGGNSLALKEQIVAKGAKSLKGTEGALPQITAELDKIADVMKTNTRITHVKLSSLRPKTADNPVTEWVMSRQDVLRSSALTH